MRPYEMDHDEMLRVARARAEELRLDWQTANRRKPGADGAAGRQQVPLARAAREAAGRTLIELGRRVLPAEAEPCS